MAFWFWVVVSLVVLMGLLLLLLSSFQIRVRYSFHNGESKLHVIVKGLYGLFYRRILVPSKTVKDRKVEPHEKKPAVMNYLVILRSRNKESKKLLADLKKIQCTRWRLDFTVGLGDAPATAISTGLLWTLTGCAVGAVGKLIQLQTSPQSRIVPNYAYTELTMVWELDLKLRFLDAMLSLMRLRQFKKSV